MKTVRTNVMGVRGGDARVKEEQGRVKARYQFPTQGPPLGLRSLSQPL